MTDEFRILTDVKNDECVIFSNDGRVYYDMQALVCQWTANVADAKVQAILSGAEPRVHAFIAGQAHVLSKILLNIDVLLTDAGMSEFAVGMGNLDEMIQTFTSE